MSDFFGGWLGDELAGDGGTEHANSASAASHWPAYGVIGAHAAHPLLKRSRLYYQQRTAGQLVGLDNQGATCYLNSLLQSLYLTPEFRQLMYDLSDAEVGLSHYLAHESAEATAKAQYERMTPAEKATWESAQKAAAAEPTEEQIDELTAMGMDRANVVRTLQKFPAASQKEAALDYLFTHDFALDPPAASVAKPAPRLYKRIPIEFRRFFAHLQLGSQAVIGTEGITRSFGWDSKEGQASVQHDIQELYIRLLEALCGSLKGTPAERMMNALYQGSMCTRTTCAVCGLVSERRESVYNFHAHVKGMRHLRQSLAELVKPEKLEGQNLYHCSGCAKKVHAWRQDTIDTLPPILTIALNRHEYNKKTWQRVKVNDRLPFPLRIDMAPYQDRQASQSKEQLESHASAAGSSSVPAPSSVARSDSAADLERAIAASLAATDTPAEEAAKAKREADDEAATQALADHEAAQAGGKGKKNKGGKGGKGGKGASHGGEDKADLDLEQGQPMIEPSEWSESSSHVYDLFSIVVHSGGAHGGHYFAYICDLVAQANYWAAHPQARVDYETFLRAPTAANTYSGDSTKSRHPSFWYECNDAAISPISFDKLASQYGGRKTCAYILMYRSRALAANPCASGDGPTPPPALQHQLALFNSQFAEERAVYDQISNEIEVELHLPTEFDVWEGQLVPAGYDPRVVEAEEKAEADRRAANQLDDAHADVMEGFALMGVGAEETEEEKAHSEAKKKAATSESQATGASVGTATASVAAAGSGSSSVSLVAASSLPAPARRLIVDQRITVPELHAKLAAFLTANELAFLDLAAAQEGKFVLNQVSLKLRPPHQVEGYLSLEDPLDQENQQQPTTTTSSHSSSVGKKKKGRRPNPKTLEQLGFSTVQQLLIWNGRTINGQPFATGTKKDQVLSLRCCVFAPLDPSAGTDGSGAPPASDFFLTVSPSTTLSQLGAILSERTGFEEATLTLHCMHPVTKAIQQLDLTSVDARPKPLKVLAVANHSVVGIEQGAPSASQAKAYFDTIAQCVKLVVLNPLAPEVGVTPLTQFELEVQKSATIGALKATILDRLRSAGHPALQPEAIRLRKISGLSKRGALLLPTQTLQQADLAEDDMRLAVEAGAMPTDTEVDLLTTILSQVAVASELPGVDQTALAKLVDRAPFLASRAWTIKQLKQAMLDRFGLQHRKESAYALYRGHATYDEHAKCFTSEFMTLAQIQIQQSDWLWLEEGEMPASGKIQLEVVMVVPNAAAEVDGASEASSSSGRDASISAAEWRARQQPLAPYTPLPTAAIPSASLPVAASAADPAAALADSMPPPAAPATLSQVFLAPPASFALAPLFHLDFSSLDTLLELKQVLHAYPSALSAAASPRHMRIRLLTRTDALGKTLLSDERTLKKQQISADKRIAVQLLADPEADLSPSTLLLRYCVGVPSATGGVLVGPPVLQEILFDDGEYPAHRALVQLLAGKTGVDPNDLAVLKWLGVGAQKDQPSEADGEKEKGSPAASQLAGQESLGQKVSAGGTPVRGWSVLFPDGPDPTEPPQPKSADASTQPGQQGKGKHQPKQHSGKNKQQQQAHQGPGKQGRQSPAGKKGAVPVESKSPPPSWCLKFGPHGLHDEDILLVLSLREFACATLVELASLARGWCLQVPPPGFRLVEKDRAEEIERRAAQDRAKKAAPKRTEVELKIEY